MRFANFAFMLNNLLYLFSSIFVTLLLLCGCRHSEANNSPNDNITERILSKPQESDGKEKKPLGYVRSIKVRNIGSLGKIFNDSNYLQLLSARQLGIEPFDGLGSYYFTKRPLVKVSNNKYYQIDSLRHSLPYLVPEAADLLEMIGKNFIDSLSKRGGDSYTIKVTSLLRTPESVGRLRRVNVNATDSSTHQYGTTFDISYTNFYCMDYNRQINQGDLKNLLAEVLNDLRLKGMCYVKYEHKTGCFHVTARQQ